MTTEYKFDLDLINIALEVAKGIIPTEEGNIIKEIEKALYLAKNVTEGKVKVITGLSRDYLLLDKLRSDKEFREEYFQQYDSMLDDLNDEANW